MIYGIDVASYQGLINPTVANKQKVSFVIVKATEGTTYINPKMVAQAADARERGWHVGFYHYVKPGSMKDQVEFFVDTAVSEPYDSLWLDWEDTGVSGAQKDAFLKELLRVRGSNHRCGLYTYQSFWFNRDKTSYAADALWIANYNGKPGDPDIEYPWLIHQYTSANAIDTNIARFDSLAAMKAWAKKGAPAPKPPAPKPPTPAKPSLQVATVVAVAKGETDYKEGAGNKNKFSTAMKRPAEEWCADFVSWVAKTAGVASLYPNTASCGVGLRWFKSKGRWGYFPAIGAQVFYGDSTCTYGYGGCHTEIVWKYDANYIYTIGGNTSATGSSRGDGVYQRKVPRKASWTHAYGYPAFKEGITIADPAKKGVKGFTYKATATAPSVAKPSRPWVWFENVRYGKVNNSIRIVQKALLKEFGPFGTATGAFGPKTKAAYKKWQQKLGYFGADADGVPGVTSLKALAKKHGFDIRYKN